MDQVVEQRVHLILHQGTRAEARDVTGCAGSILSPVGFDVHELRVREGGWTEGHSLELFRIQARQGVLIIYG